MVWPLREKIARLEAENNALRHDWLVGLERGGWPDKHRGEVEWDEVYGPRDSDVSVVVLNRLADGKMLIMGSGCRAFPRSGGRVAHGGERTGSRGV